MQFILDNWEWFLLGFYILEKVVKITPVKWDDLLVDGIKEALNAVLKRDKNAKRLLSFILVLAASTLIPFIANADTKNAVVQWSQNLTGGVQGWYICVSLEEGNFDIGNPSDTLYFQGTQDIYQTSFTMEVTSGVTYYFAVAAFRDSNEDGIKEISPLEQTEHLYGQPAGPAKPGSITVRFEDIE